MRKNKKPAPPSARSPYVLYCSACGSLCFQCPENPDRNWEYLTGYPGIKISAVASRFLSASFLAEFPGLEVESGSTTICTQGLHGYTSFCAQERRRLEEAETLSTKAK